MAQITLAQLREQSKGRPDNLTIEMPDGTKAVLVHLLLLPNASRDAYLDALEKFMAISVDEDASREERRAADKATGRKVGTTKSSKTAAAQTKAEAAAAAAEDETFTQEDLTEFIGQIREGLVDIDTVFETAGAVIESVILDKAVARKALPQLDAIDRATLIQLHLGSDQQGEA